ncbi:MAG: efflux RND transporter permease subunit [Candidatus Cloacimonadales bacterium]|jgi:HAE1 family hydrophobic/amphiphilic exporter-1|nr:efflux RND transporter permease subunit [Candidatus Cloacimonadota bacterium]MDD2650492.1 efflux RND transporter permease subunit [Candidatus Cloacimonadota bacterium]MDX9976849.1 efflux RND transporter permease subunit [Candidatus Cloacimonadales bacterium]
MKITEQAVKRPIFTSMVVLIIIILGSISLSRLPIDLMPDVSSPTISVSTSYSNANPLAMEELVTKIIEEAVSAVPGVEEISSQSSEGVSNVQVSFKWGSDLEVAANDIRERLDRIISRLPEEASRPSLRKFDMAAMPVVNFGVVSDLDPIELRMMIDDQVKRRFERVAGVASVDVRGGLEKEIHVNLNLDKIQSLNISLDEISRKIRTANINIPTGEVHRGNYQVSVRVPGTFEDLEQLSNTLITRRNGVNIFLKDIAQVESSSSKVSRYIRINQQAGIQISANKQSGTNTVQVVKGLLSEMERVNETFPTIKVIPLIDTSVFIKQSINNLVSSAFLGGILAILVLLFFLRNIKSTLVIATSIPISITATFGLLYFNGFTLNLMTLGGMALGIGSLLDNSIVVLENIFRHRELGVEQKEAAIIGTEEVTMPIIASTLTSLVVFLPVVFMRGFTGVLFQQLAWVIVFSMACSLLSALTLVPVLSSRMLSVHVDEKVDKKSRIDKRIFARISVFLTDLEDKYVKALKYALGNRKKVIYFTIAILLGSLVFLPLIGSELMPQADEGEIRINFDMDAGTKLDLTDEAVRIAEQLILDNVPEAVSTVTSVGGFGFGGNAPNTANIRLKLLSKSERRRTDEQIANHVRQLVSNLPGVRVRVSTASSNMMTRIMSRGGGRIEVQVKGHDQETALKLAQETQKRMETVNGITDINISRSAGSPENLLIIDRVKAAEFGLTVEQIANALKTILSGLKSGEFSEEGKEYPIVLQIPDAEYFELDAVLNLNIINDSGTPVMLKNVIKIEEGKSSTQISRVNQERIIYVSANLAGRSMSNVIKDLQKEVVQIHPPIGYSVEIAGDIKEQEKAFRELLVSIILALMLIFAVMASQYESYKDPFIVMFAVPLAVIGVILILFLTGTTFNIQSYIGLIMLGGIVVNNAILLVDTTNNLHREEKLPLYEAIVEAGRRRLRPILMTALTTILGMLPLAIGIGEGSEMQAPLARVVVGGLFSSSLITLLVIPVVYSLFEQKSKSKKSRA